MGIGFSPNHPIPGLFTRIISEKYFILILISYLIKRIRVEGIVNHPRVFE
ncbi:hypothetical protein HanHA300_Chr08g0269251 [Helianthus annuus]|nr:hypothetical protein HanHA300_Chr08g0269251 [Helianthus annuus]KAJ0718210.1 hypothetical protein HanLR1_Chr08g0268121 [Helianthus annuus]